MQRGVHPQHLLAFVNATKVESDENSIRKVCVWYLLSGMYKGGFRWFIFLLSAIDREHEHDFKDIQ